MVNEFALMVGLGGSLGLLRVAQAAPQGQAARRLNAGLLVLAGCLVGARLVYVLLRGGYYSQHTAEAFQFWQGGLSGAGAVAGGLIALFIAAFVERLSPLGLADDLTPLLAPLVIAVWLGCWQAGCAYGKAALAGAWWGVPASDESRVVALRWPLQLLAALSLLAYFWWLEAWFAPRAGADGRLGCLAGLGLGLNVLVVSLLRQEAVFRWQGQSLDTWAALGLCLVCIITGIIAPIGNKAMRE